MKKYFVRVCRYILRLVILLAVVLTVMTFMRMGSITSFAEALFVSNRGLLLLALILAVGMLYPLFGFTRTEVKCDISRQRESIINAFASCSYVVESSEEGGMTFRAKSFIRRLNYGFNDRITVTSDGKYITVEGLKREVVRIESRLRTFMAMQ